MAVVEQHLSKRGFFNTVLGQFRACTHMVVHNTSYMLCMGSWKLEKIGESPQSLQGWQRRVHRPLYWGRIFQKKSITLKDLPHARALPFPRKLVSEGNPYHWHFDLCISTLAPSWSLSFAAWCVCSGLHLADGCLWGPVAQHWVLDLYLLSFPGMPRIHVDGK